VSNAGLLGGVSGIAVYTPTSGERIVYVADDYRIMKVNSQNALNVLAGGVTAGAQDGNGASAGFGVLAGMVVDGAGNLFVVDSGNHAIRKISPVGVVTTVAGTLGQSGNVDGMGVAARFNSPKGIAIDTRGNLFVADTGNHEIRKITPNGQVSTVVGAAGRFGTLAQTSLPGALLTPIGVAVLPDGQLVIADGPGLFVTQGGQF
jgi:sugar lactone lactonase YvrE